MIDTAVKSKKAKKENLKQRAYKNSFAAIFDYLSRVLTGFVVEPFLVIGLGNRLYGIWKVLSQVTDYTNLADIQVTEVLKWALAKDREIVKKEVLRKYLTATLLLVILILPLILILGAIITWYSPIITNAEAEYYTVVRITCSLLVLYIVTDKLFGIFESIIEGMNIGYKSMRIRAFVYMFGGGLQILVMYLDYGIIGLAVVQILIAIVIGLIFYIVIKKNVEWYGWGTIEVSKVKSFFNFSGWFMGLQGANLLIFSMDKVLLSYLIGPVIVTQYVITFYLVKTIQGGVARIIDGVSPGMGKLFGEGRFEKLVEVRNHMRIIILILSSSMGTSVLLINNSFTNLWIGEGQFAGQLVTLLLILLIIQFLLIRNDKDIIKATLDLKNKFYITLLSGVISIFISIPLVKYYGLLGLCIGFLIGRSIMSFGYSKIIFSKLEVDSAEFILSYRIFICVIAIFSISYYLGVNIMYTSWMKMVLVSIISFICSLIVFYNFGLVDVDKKVFKNYFYKIKLI